MSTVTTKRLPDPDDDSIESSVRRFESTLRFWSPLLLGPFKSAAPFTYSGAIALSTIIGYALFLAPSLVIATLVADVATNVALFTTITTVVGSLGAVISVFLTHAWIPFVAGLALYTLLLLNYEPEEPNGTADALFGTSEWQKLTHSLYICVPLFVASAIYAVVWTTPLAFVGCAVASWWILRRVTFTVLWDETRYMVEPPMTEMLVSTRLPTLVGAFAVLMGYHIAGLVLLLTPFAGAIVYLKWRAQQGADDSQSLDTVRMHERSGIPTDFTQDMSPEGAYSGYAVDTLFRKSIEKFNSLLETEIDTTRRVHIPEGRLEAHHINTAVEQAEDIYNDFNEVAYRPDRFEDAFGEVQKYGQKYQTKLEEEGL